MIPLSQLYQLGDEQLAPFTLLGVGPLSKTVVDAAIECAIDHDAPLVFIASRNQVESHELGGGYVEGWDQEGFRCYVHKKVQEYQFSGMYFLGRDHGGPWQKDEEYHSGLGWEQALENAMASYRQDIDAGFDYLHLDTSKDPHARGTVSLDLAVDRIIQLMQHIEAYRRRSGKNPIDYEVSLEETNGDCSPVAEFDYFVGKLVRELDRYGLPMPLFMVGNTGTLTKMDRNVGSLDFEIIAQLKQITAKHSMIFKEHNADYLDPTALARHPQLGIGMANVAPEFGKLETEALLNLARQEDAILGSRHHNRSGIQDILLCYIQQSTKWQKWIYDVQDSDLLFQDPVWQEKLLLVNGHYFFQEQAVREARCRLFDNCVALKMCVDPHAFVKANIKKGIARYFETFNLQGLNGRIRALMNPAGVLFDA